MKLYSTKATNSIEDQDQLLSKYVKSIDTSIQSVVNFIDTFYRNYILVNRASDYRDDNNRSVFYYTDAQLVWLDVIDDEEEPTYINLSKMRPHQVVENHYGIPLNIKYNGNLLTEVVPQGYALRHEGFDSEGNAHYGVISFASSGAYYILQDIQYTSNGFVLIWSLQENATDIYGLNYLFSILWPDERCYWHNTDNLINWQLQQSPIILPNFIFDENDDRIVKIGSKNNSLWTTSKLLWHEAIYKKTDSNARYVEDIIDDSQREISTTRVGEVSQSRYTITSNLAHWAQIYFNLL